ncbi:6-carboxytetrahydropterin synthase [Saccharothrix sp. AJ9571]|nr:6-carboxytetrahydropterin synthase [Saccharothrix sp. AJ9571]
MEFVDHDPHEQGKMMMLTRRFSFSASHELWQLPTEHKCRRNHGHNYVVTVVARVHDAAASETLASLGEYLDARFDHRLLNDQVSFHPTSELLAVHLAEWFDATIAAVTPMSLGEVVVSETETTSARCDGATRKVTIAKSFETIHGEATLVLGADTLDHDGFVTDFGDLAPFARHLRSPSTETRLRHAGPALVAHLAGWFIDNVEPDIHGRLASLRIEERTTTGLWERGAAA